MLYQGFLLSFFTINIYNASLFTETLRHIEKYGWGIADINITNNLLIYENKQKGIKLYSRIDDNFPYSGVIEEIFVREVYKSDFANNVVIDVGAYRGESAIYFAMNGGKKVIALEPDEDGYNLALMKVKENNLENKVLLLNKALAPKEGVINFYKYLHSPYANSIDSNNISYTSDKIIIKQV